MDFKQERQSYQKAAYADKRISVLALLKGLEGKGEIFDSLFSFIVANPEGASEGELDEVFDIVMSAIEGEDAERIQESMHRLGDLQNRMKALREREEREKAEERPEAILIAL